jgi:hypothetical protein
MLMGMAGLNGYAQNVEVGVVAGGAGYIGDLNPDNLFKISGLNAGAFVKLNLDPYWNIGLHYNYGRIEADDARSNNAHFKQRDLRFHTPINEVSLQGEFNFFEYTSSGRGRRFSPYIFAGIGGYFFNPKVRKANGENLSLAYLRTENQSMAYRQYGISIPYGVGAKLRIAEAWTLFGQVGYRSTFTDYLDDVGSGYYFLPPLSTLTPAQINNLTSRQQMIYANVTQGPPGTQRGDFRKRDTYMFAGIGISFTFVSQKCYTF